jgi:hypothetical protein
MNRSRFVLAVLVLLSFAATTAFAKRSPPEEVPTVRHGELEYRVPHRTGSSYLPGFVEAWDPAKNCQVWFRQIYVIRRNPDLEGDVQDVFITQIKHVKERNVLEITNERNGVYELDLTTLEVKVIKGQAVVSMK